MKKTVYEFVELMKKLRAPGGCPWDREQTHKSISTNLLEEAYEAYDAIVEGDDLKTARRARRPSDADRFSRDNCRGRGQI